MCYACNVGVTGDSGAVAAWVVRHVGHGFVGGQHAERALRVSLDSDVVWTSVDMPPHEVQVRRLTRKTPGVRVIETG